MNQTPVTVSDNPAQSRFELSESGATAFANYRLEGDVLTIPYVESPPALRGGRGGPGPRPELKGRAGMRIRRVLVSTPPGTRRSPEIVRH
jgi:hypothetical protein